MKITCGDVYISYIFESFAMDTTIDTSSFVPNFQRKFWFITHEIVLKESLNYSLFLPCKRKSNLWNQDQDIQDQTNEFQEYFLWT